MTDFKRFGKGTEQRSIVAVRKPTLSRSAPDIGPLARSVDLPARFERYATDGTRRTGIVIALDATSSMSELIGDAKRHLGAILEEAERRDVQDVELVAYRDYDCGEQVLEASGRAQPTELRRFLQRLGVMGGGGNDGEAVEAALAHALGDPHTPRSAEASERAPLAPRKLTAIFVAGDEPAHPERSARTQAPGGRSAEWWASEAASREIPIFTFVVPGHPNEAATRASFARIAELSRGMSGVLDGSDAMKDMIALALASRTPTAAVDLRGMLNKKTLSPASRQFGQRLLKAHEP